MKTRNLLLSALCQIFLLMTGAVLAIAQTSAPQMPPPVLSIFRNGAPEPHIQIAAPSLLTV